MKKLVEDVSQTSQDKYFRGKPLFKYRWRLAFSPKKGFHHKFIPVNLTQS